MAKKDHPVWVCSECGEEYTTWAGRCTNCGQWNTLKEVRLPSLSGGRGGKGAPITERINPVPLVATADQQLPSRLQTKMGEVDRVLGGGFFPGTVALLAGEPGIGKSTLLLALAEALSDQTKVLYASGEESTDQIQHRARRLGINAGNAQLISTTDLNQILFAFEELKPGFVIIDSIQTIADTSFPSAPGSIVQVRECALALQRWAKQNGSTLVLVGHVTKEGTLAGPRTLEHLVDVVINLEGERSSDLRLLRSQKNRFGPTDEVGILEMTESGLVAVENPSARFLQERVKRVPGSVVTVILEGTRPILVEIQALTRTSVTAYPRRTASGFDLGRLELLIAVLESRAGVRLGKLDCYVNVSGGLKIREPAVDLAVALAIASAAKNQPVNERLAAFGEIGLAGEVRTVTQAQRRETEAKRLGFSQVNTAKNLRDAITQMV